jgi:drug/metabolite transporter (DMT)-like permease
MKAPQQSMNLLAWSLLLLLAVIWGGSYLSNRIALDDVPVFTTVAFRVGGAALALWLFVLIRGLRPLPRFGQWLALIGMGVFNNVIPFSLIVWGQQHIPTGLAAILNAATALLTVLLAALIFADERLTTGKAMGVLTGFVGVIIVIGPAVLHQFDLTALGQLAMLGAALFYAISGCYARLLLKGMSPVVQAAGTLAGAALVMIPLALWADGWPMMDYGLPAWGALAYLALVSSAFAYVLFYKVLALAGAGNLGLVTLLVGPVAAAMGAVAYGETLPIRTWAGFGVITFGLILIDGRMPKILREFRSAPR